jgi:hypothetical protein
MCQVEIQRGIPAACFAAAIRGSSRMSRTLHHLLADGVLVIHIAYVGFVVIGLVLILLGGLRRWSWVRNRWFRRAHLAAIGLVVVQAWLGIVCPLTTLEMHLREKAGDAIYQESFIAHWLHRLLFFNAPPWVFTLCYSAFGLAVIASWWLVRPSQHRSE